MHGYIQTAISKLPIKKSERIIINKGTKKLNLFLKHSPENKAIDKIGVKFGGCGAILVNAATNTIKTKNILFIYIPFIDYII